MIAERQKLSFLFFSLKLWAQLKSESTRTDSTACMHTLVGKASFDDLCIADVTCVDRAAAHGPDQIAHAWDSFSY